MTARPILSDNRRSPACVVVAQIIEILAVLMAAIIICPIADAENYNVTPVTTPFITIDSIGNHTIGDVFFINGTTNLPITEPLLMNIYHFDLFCCSTIPGHSLSDACPGFSLNNVAEVSDFSISSDLSGPNRFSVNVTDTMRDFVRGDYVVFVCSNQTCSAGLVNNQESCLSRNPGGRPTPQKDFFTLNQTKNSTPSTIPRTVVPSPDLIQSTTSQNIIPLRTQSSPLPIVLPIIALSTLVILRFTLGKKRD